MLAPVCRVTRATGSDAPIAPEHVIQLAVRAAEAGETPPGTDRRSNETFVEPAIEDGVGLLLAADAGVDADGEPQAIASKNSDAIRAMRLIWIHLL